MRRLGIAVLLIFAAALAVTAQRPRSPFHPQLEVKSMLPYEYSPGKYQQVPLGEIQQAAREGWELVSVMPYVYMNEERGKEQPKPVVTQTYRLTFSSAWCRLATGRPPPTESGCWLPVTSPRQWPR